MPTFTITRSRPSKTKSKPPQTEQANDQANDQAKDQAIDKDRPQIPALEEFWAKIRPWGGSEAPPSTTPPNAPVLNTTTARTRDGNHAPLVHAKKTVKPPGLLKPREDGPATISGDDAQKVSTGKASTGQDSGVSLRENTRTSGVVAELSAAPIVGLTIESPKKVTQVSQASPQLNSSKGKGKEVDRRAGPSGSATDSSNHGLSVRLPLSKLERLSKLNFVGSMDLRAQSVRMTKAEETKLRTFSTFLSTAKTQIILFGKQMPRCRHRLVTLDTGTPPAPVKYICIEGLRDPADIKLFHKVMSQTRYRSLYEPWKLCYEASSISKPAASHYAVQKLKDKDTYCGAVLELQDGADRWLSTIGGLVEIGGQLYAMTTAHQPDEAPPFVGDDSSFPASPADTLVEDNFPDDVESAYVFTPDTATHTIPPRTSLERKFSTLSSSTSPSPPPFPFDLPYARPIIHGQDWQLIPVYRQRQLPNSIHEPWRTEKNYIFDVCDSPSGRSVAVNAGISGICYGTMSLSASFLIGDDDLVQEIWTVDGLESATSGIADLAQGDSGSWVLDITESDNFTAVGHVVACSSNRAHVSLMSTEFDKVNLITLGSDRVRLASPFEALLDYARSLTEDVQRDRAKMLVDEALSPKFLSKAAAGSDLALTVQRFFAEVEDSPWQEVERELLEEVLTQYSDIASYLADTSTFSGFQDRHATTFERLRKIYRAIKSERNTHAIEPAPQLLARYPFLSRRDKAKPLIQPTPSRLGGGLRLPEPEEATNTDHPVIKPELDNMAHSHAPQPSKTWTNRLWKRDAEKGGSRRLNVFYLLWFPYALISHTLGGTAAAYAWLGLYAFDHGGPIPIRPSTGTFAGLISGGLICFQLLVMYITSWMSSMDAPFPESFVKRTSFATIGSTFKSILLLMVVLGTAYARAMLLVLYLCHQAGFQPTGILYSAAAVAALPLLASSSSPFYLYRQYGDLEYATTFNFFSFSLVWGFGYDLLAATAYAGVSKSLGQNVMDYIPAVATTAIYNAVCVFWPVPVALLLSPLLFCLK
ncbi:hypothetical protein B0T22DRAFT_160720 [Podospora appendiculata]|uniref:Uncharacterized protein n=1 Tax=Podospora appendiculata TaxID=314037 RepID=A0AAE0X9T6_9PEZI|nr:hypothetical protein B0T22DRAFT_160720 [Podospora appendiculata]